MKHLLSLLLIVCLFSLQSASQKYTITYQSKIWNQNTKKYENTHKIVLSISDSISYEYIRSPYYRIKEPLGKKFVGHSTYKNLSTQKMLSQSHLFSEVKCLIVDTIPQIIWKIEKDSAIILSFKCYKATCEYNNRPYIAWFAPDLKPSLGPSYFGGLPGVILEMGNSQWMTTAIKVIPEVSQIVEPGEGKKMSSKEFDELKKSFYEKYNIQQP